ncbi:hypothetical protein PACILC2_30820 [Paenibacillus cisolokensis]|uniref:Uncharacterized protein n=1 Tax=Paenibacillus cisolokensis TaxID=1658519 RepID=A0ABQ4N8G3_9BACL|nr:hypothetical protein PACILC2_30820 [Paenibacillus cisolokensis]
MVTSSCIRGVTDYLFIMENAEENEQRAFLNIPTRCLLLRAGSRRTAGSPFGHLSFDGFNY